MHNKLDSIHPVVGYNSYRNTMSRREQAVQARCRVGLSCLTHEFILDGSSTTEWVGCSAQYGINHISVHCVDFAHVPEKFYTVDTIFHLFDIIAGDAIIRYLKAVGLNCKIYIFLIYLYT